MNKNQPDNNTLLDFALDAVFQIGRITLGHYQTKLQAERKSDNTPVTAADQQAEQHIRKLINQYWPDHAIIGEEYGQSASDSRYTWIIDPIDGTKSFVSGVPLYANLLALRDGDETLIGIANFPALGDMIYAVRGQGCFWNGRRAQVSAVNQLSDAVILTSDINYYGAKGEAWNRLVRQTYTQRTWGDAFGYFLVATGRAEVMLDPAMYIWDSAPFQVIMEEAGGTFTDWKGTSNNRDFESIATNGILFEKVMNVINEE